MKIAIVQDDIVRKGGAEQVALSFHNAFPEAPIYTLTYDPVNSYPEFKKCDIQFSWFGRVIKSEKNMKRFFFPFALIAMRQLDFKGYDVILQSTTHCAKYIKVDKNAIVITYCHTPFRLAWEPGSYEKVTGAGFLKSALIKRVVAYLKIIDKASAQRTNYFIANSNEVVPRVRSAYGIEDDIAVINPSVKCANFHIAKDIDDYYLVVSRFETYKMVDLVIEAFNKMPQRKLIIIGKGSREKELVAIAGQNIKFLKGLNTSELAFKYSHCKAFIFPQLEDYGITPLEANASGRPVLAFGKGGILDTMIPFTDDSMQATAVLFHQQTAEALTDAVNLFETLQFDPAFIRRHAETFDDACFIKKIKNFVASKTAPAIISKLAESIQTQ